MLISNKGKKIIKYIIITLLIITILVLYLKIKTINNIVNIIFLSFILAYTLKPLRDILSDKFKIKKRTSSIIIVFSILLTIVLFFYILIPSILKETYNLGSILDNVDNYVEALAKKMNIDNISFF